MSFSLKAASAVFLIVTFSLLFFSLASYAEDQEASFILKDQKRRCDPIELTGKLFPQFQGKPYANLRLMIFKEGKFISTPYEFDERRPDNSFILSEGTEGSKKGANNRFDAQDILLFMISDTGDRGPAENFAERPEYVQEMEFTDPNNGSRSWSYLVYYPQNPPPADFPAKVYLEEGVENFVSHGRSWVIGGFVNKIGKRIYKTAINDRFWTPKEAGGSGQNIFDRMKTRAFANMMFGTIKIEVNENSVIGELNPYQVGKIRGFGRNWLSIVSPMGIKSPRMYLDIFCYDTMILIPMTVHVFMNPGLLLTEGGMSYGYDLNSHAIGMKFYNNLNPEGFSVNGSMDEKEKKMNRGVDEWRCITGPQGTMVTASVWDPAYLKQTEATINYIDDIKTEIKPENIPGALGYFYNRSVARNVKPGWYESLLCWFFPPHFYDPNRFKIEMVNEYLDIRRKPIVVKIGRETLKNPGGWPPHLIPTHKSD